MEYNMPLYRPPSEAYSLILQATLGCSHNKCSFCMMYRTKKFKVRPFRDFEKDVLECADNVPEVKRIFLADGDALVMSTSQMLRRLDLLYSKFPYLERVTSYASPQNLIKKKPEGLKAIRAAGLTMLYYGIETGDDELLTKIVKGVNFDGIVEGAHKAQESGLDLSCTVLLGLGGKKGSDRHISETVRILNKIEPRYIGALTLMLPVPQLKEWYAKQMSDGWVWLDTMELLREIRDMVAGLETSSSVFRSNHASNYLALKGTLKRDREQMLHIIDQALSDPDSSLLRPEEMRGL